jgi:CubicO group peptidase (beta-lactamase class C family)
MEEYVSAGDVAGLVAVVVRGDDTHVDAVGSLAFGGAPMRSDSIVRIAPLTKPIAAAAAMVLVDDGVLRLDDAVDPWLPELADRRVLRSRDAALDDTIPARRAITLHDLLTCRAGYGMVMPFGARYPIQVALAEAGLSPGPWQPRLAGDEVMRRFGALPLAHQPGAGWLYHSSFDVLAVLVARAAGTSFGEFLRARLFEPLGMGDTHFEVPAEKAMRLATGYVNNASGRAVAADDADHTLRRPSFESGATGLTSTADDYLAFCRMLLAGGRAGRERVLSTPAVELMTRDHLTHAQRGQGGPFLQGGGWGFGVGVVAQHDDVATVPRGFGWAGGYGTTAWIDPSRDLIGLMFTQRLMDAPVVTRMFVDFWNEVYGRTTR